VKNLKRYLGLALILFAQVGFAQLPSLEKGIIDLHSFDFIEQGPFTLNGEWEFYMSQLISPEDFASSDPQPKDFVDFPSAWSASSGSQNFGFATYRVTLILPKNQTLALQIPHCYSNYRLWANGQIIASNGTVGKSPESSKPQWLPKTVGIPTSGERTTLILQISNFHHAIGGIREPIIIGDHEEMNFRDSISLTSNLTLVIGLGVFFIVYLFVFLLYKTNSVILFSSLCLIWGVRELFSNLYVAIHYMPDFPWELAVKIEYVSLFLVMIISMLFIGSLFKEDVNNVFKYLFCFCNLVFVCIAVSLDAAIYTQFLPVYLAFAAALLLYIVYVLIRAVVYERQGVWLVIACLFLGVIVFSYDLISYQGLANFNPLIISIGYMAMFILLAVALLFQVGIFKRSAATNILTYEDLYGGNNSMR
jgi:hypothetical protein